VKTPTSLSLRCAFHPPMFRRLFHERTDRNFIVTLGFSYLGHLFGRLFPACPTFSRIHPSRLPCSVETKLFRTMVVGQRKGARPLILFGFSFVTCAFCSLPSRTFSRLPHVFYRVKGKPSFHETFVLYSEMIPGILGLPASRGAASRSASFHC